MAPKHNKKGPPPGSHYLAHCFICEAELEDNSSDEHVVPRWMIRLLVSANAKVSDLALKREVADYDQHRVPCCAACNRAMNQSFEQQIASKFSEARDFATLDPGMLRRWLFKIHWGTQYRDHSPGIRNHWLNKSPDFALAAAEKYIRKHQDLARERILHPDQGWLHRPQSWTGTYRGLSTWLFMPHLSGTAIAFADTWAFSCFEERAGHAFVVPSENLGLAQLLNLSLLARCIEWGGDDICPACAYRTFLPVTCSDLEADSGGLSTFGLDADSLMRCGGFTIRPAPRCPECLIPHIGYCEGEWRQYSRKDVALLADGFGRPPAPWTRRRRLRNILN